MNDYVLHEVMQTAYKKVHSMETALVKVQNDILVNDKRGVILVLFDVSAAFDTIDHATLFHQVKYRLGISRNALNWVKSYLSDCT